MIERASEFGASAAVPLVTGDASMQSAGEMLRAAREAHGIDVAVVAAALKVPVQKVEALEADDFEALPDPVFARALAASICRALRIDPKPILEKLPGARQPGLAEGQRRVNATFRPAPARNGGGGAGSRVLVVIVALLLIGAALLVWLPPAKLEQFSSAVDRVLSGGSESTTGENATSAADSTSTSTSPTTAQTSTAVVSAPVLAPAAPAAGTSTPPMAATTPAGAAPMAPAAPAAGTTPAGSMSSAGSAGGAAPASGAAASGAASAQTAAADPNAVLSFSARSEAWISVTDAAGKQVLRRLVKAGETVAVPGEPPLAVVVGNAAGVDVSVRGKAFDLKELTRSGGVARFEVKP
jgi:cytoskeleton protein RodZ